MRRCACGARLSSYNDGSECFPCERRRARRALRAQEAAERRVEARRETPARTSSARVASQRSADEREDRARRARERAREARHATVRVDQDSVDAVAEMRDVIAPLLREASS